jgi:hypothetical protein
MIKRFLSYVIPSALIVAGLVAGMVLVRSFLGGSALAQRLVAMDLYPDHAHHPTPEPTITPTPRVEPGATCLLLPAVLRQPTAAPWCDPYEPNDDRRVNPWGPLQPGVRYSARLCRGDPEDNYTFDVARAGSGSVDVTLSGASVGRSHILVYATSDLDRVVADHGPIRDASYRLAFDASQAGRYVVRLYASAWDDVSPYELRVSVP